jgi:hypothetical protein
MWSDNRQRVTRIGERQNNRNGLFSKNSFNEVRVKRKVWSNDQHRVTRIGERQNNQNSLFSKNSFNESRVASSQTLSGSKVLVIGSFTRCMEKITTDAVYIYF